MAVNRKVMQIQCREGLQNHVAGPGKRFTARIFRWSESSAIYLLQYIHFRKEHWHTWVLVALCMSVITLSLILLKITDKINFSSPPGLQFIDPSTFFFLTISHSSALLSSFFPTESVTCHWLPFKCFQQLYSSCFFQFVWQNHYSS